MPGYADATMASSPTVSVVLIFYNDERFLAEAVDSVLGQTYQDFELILADDGSTDGSTTIARSYTETHPERVRYVEHPGHANRGISATRNLGIAASGGEYVAFLDSDDVWEAEKLAEQVAILEENPKVGLVVGASRYWHSWAGEKAAGRDEVKPVGAPQNTVTEPPQLSLLLYPLGTGVAPCPSSCIARRELVERLGGFEDHMPGLYDDQGFLAKAYLATPVYVDSRCWDRYRRHQGQVMVSDRGRYDEVRRYFLEWYRQYLRKAGVQDRRVHRALRRALLPYRYPRLAVLRALGGRARVRLSGRS